MPPECHFMWDKRMNKHRYVFDENSKIMIYGAATEGHLLYKRLGQYRDNIVCFIDRRAGEIGNINGIPVYSLDSEVFNSVAKSDIIAVIAVKNVFNHREIAYRLNLQGIKRIICIPVNISELSTSTKSEIEDVYNDLFYRQIQFPYEIEELFINRLYEFKREDYRFELEGRVVIPVPISRVYTNNTKESLWGDINIAAYFPHIRLFQFFAGKPSGVVDSYLRFCVEAATNVGVDITEAWKQNVIDNRRVIYNEMLMNYELDHQFFIQHASRAKWNEKNSYFNLTSGKHRAIFLTTIGALFIPLSVSKSDEEKWVDIKHAREFFNEINKGNNNIGTIDNPYFYRLMSTTRRIDTDAFVYMTTLIAERLHDKIGKVDFHKCCITCDEQANKYAIDNLVNMGCLLDKKSMNAKCVLKAHIDADNIVHFIDNEEMTANEVR